MKKTVLSLIALLLALLLTLASCAAGSKSEMGDAAAPGAPNYNWSMNSKPEAGEEADDAYDNESNGFAENPFVATSENNISTFSADVDTASYTYFRKLVSTGSSLETLKATAASFRTEEFINYFKYDAKQPEDGELFGVTADFLPCPWNSATTLMRLTLQAEDAIATEGNNLVFLIDVSGSMSSKDKLPLLQKTFSYLVGNLTENDKVSIVTYSGREAVVLDGCPGNQDENIMKAINKLNASGSTNGEAGLTMAYQIAEKHLIEGGNNRIIMASDGDLNVGISSSADLKAYIAGKRDSGVYLSVLGFGTGNYRDANMEALADNGNGMYYYIDGESEAEKVFGTDLLGTLYTVAEDVKLQLTFDPKYVSSYRLIGYENRILNTEDFEDDTKDAGEVGAGHQVTVCYELTLSETAASTNDAWMQLAVRYKKPGEANSLLNEYLLGKNELCDRLDDDQRFLVCVIQTVMLLHNSKYLGTTSLSGILEDLNALDLSDTRAEFRSLVQSIAK